MGKITGKTITPIITEMNAKKLMSKTKTKGTIKNNNKVIDIKAINIISAAKALAPMAATMPKAGNIQKSPRTEATPHTKIKAIAIDIARAIFEPFEGGVSFIELTPVKMLSINGLKICSYSFNSSVQLSAMPSIDKPRFDIILNSN